MYVVYLFQHMLCGACSQWVFVTKNKSYAAGSLCWSSSLISHRSPYSLKVSVYGWCTDSSEKVVEGHVLINVHAYFMQHKENHKYTETGVEGCTYISRVCSV